MTISPKLFDRVKKVLSSKTSIFLIILLIILTSWQLTLWQKQSSKLLLTTLDNKFKLSFVLKPTDQDNFSAILEKFQLPQSVKDGLEFELDATSQAKLAFVTPLAATLTVTQKDFSFKGHLSQEPLLAAFPIERVKLPADTNLLIAASNLQDLALAKLNLPDALTSWLDKNLVSKSGQYFVVFGQDAHFAVIFQNDQIDFESLKNIQGERDEPLYKEELQDTLNFHLLKVLTAGENGQFTLTFFQLGPWTFLVSSPTAAKELLALQKSESAQAFVPGSFVGKTFSLGILFKNSDANPANLDNFPLSIDIIKFLKPVESLEFILKQDQFSGLINLK